MNPDQIQRRLNDNGFPCGAVDGQLGPRSQEAVRRFQIAYCGPGGWLDVDGVAGPKTQTALEFLPRLSTHFSVSELWCKHCHCTYVRRELLSGLEELRSFYGRPIYLLSAYRCDAHNRSQGGAPKSMHRWGGAADIDTVRSAITVVETQRIRRFSGIGNRGVRTAHVDIRHLIPEHNETPAASPTSPARWQY